MVYVGDTDSFKNINEKYNEFELSFLKKTKDTVKGLRKTFTQQVADDISDKVMKDCKGDMYPMFLDFANDLWKESLEYILGKKTYQGAYSSDRTFNDFIQGMGYDAESLRKKIYEENKEEIKQGITEDYLYDMLEHFFYNSSYWKGIDLNFTKPYTQYRIMEAFMKRLAIDEKFDETLSTLVDKSIMDKKKELHRLQEEILELSNKLNELVGQE